jgi:formylglycine-generating enzyme required for sulfatase activity
MMTSKNPKSTQSWLVIIALIIVAMVVVACGDDSNDNDSSSDNPNTTVSGPAITLAENGVSSNAEWQPYVQEFNGVEMVLVPIGCFTMGSTNEQIDSTLQICEENGYQCERTLLTDEQPAHQQCFTEPFWINRTQVTLTQYNECVAAGICTEQRRPTWFEANSYCIWRDARLPTEREWEYAARGPDNLLYLWGNEFVTDNVGNDPNGASWVGAVDMSDNLSEWTSTIYDQDEFPYPYVIDGREDIEINADFRVLRGSSLDNNQNFARAADRDPADPNFRYRLVSFRCALDYDSHQ